MTVGTLLSASSPRRSGPRPLPGTRSRPIRRGSGPAPTKSRGLYRGWLQFQRGGRVLTAELLVRSLTI
ncbi:MAG: hypothetical protein ACRD3M_08385 [Thermoanaerobaculia bacterium]